MTAEAGEPRGRSRRSPAKGNVARRPQAPKAAVLPPIEELVAAARPDLPPPARHDENGAEPVPAGDPTAAHLATQEELADWDAVAVASPNGHAYQSLAWAEYRAAHGWRTWQVAFDDGFRVLVLGRPTDARDAGAAYASRGPIPERDPAVTAARAAAIADLLAAEGLASLTIDGETPAASGLTAHLAGAGFSSAEEEQPSRHRMDIRLGPDDSPNSDEKTIFGSFGATARNGIRQAERHGLRVRRLDAGGGRLEEEYGSSELSEFDPIDINDAAAVDEVLRTFYGMVDAAAKRRSFALGSEELFLDWAQRGIAPGHILYLQADHPEDGPVAGALFYRHGHRLSYALAGERAGLRRTYPGASRLLVWRGIQIALDERRTSVDMGGVDTDKFRFKPDKGDPTYSGYQFRESFGARWVEMTGAHRKTMRATPATASKVLARRVLARLTSVRR